MSTAVEAPSTARPESVNRTRNATFLVFSGELDRQLMAFTLANAAAASGVQTTMFFTFWGVAALRRRRRSTGKGLIDRIFGRLLPLGSRRLGMSRLNFGGIGPLLIRWRMRRRGLASLEQQIEIAEALGVRFVACDASLEIMGLDVAELRESVVVGGATACVGGALEAELSLVI